MEGALTSQQLPSGEIAIYRMKQAGPGSASGGTSHGAEQQKRYNQARTFVLAWSCEFGFLGVSVTAPTRHLTLILGFFFLPLGDYF